MTLAGWAQIVVFLAIALALVRPLGGYVAWIFAIKPGGLEKTLGPFERGIYRACGIRPEAEMSFRQYAVAVLLFHLVGTVVVYAIQRLQGGLPLNPQGMPAVPPPLAFNTAISFVTNTNWQAYAGERAMSYLTQMLALTVQNFLSAAAGLAILAAFIRGLVRHEARTIGNFWVDVVRATLYVLLPLAFLLAVFFVFEGVVQTLTPYPVATLLEPARDSKGNAVIHQVIAVGPVASQEAIKLLGSNGGGFFNANSAHPFENPTALSNIVQMLAIVGLPAALTHTFGRAVGDTRQGVALLAAMGVIFVVLLAIAVGAEQAGNPLIASLGVDVEASSSSPGGNMEGKEARFGIPASALFATVTTAVSCGATNSTHDSFMPLGGLVALWLIQLGEVVFGGVGSGLYVMLVFAIVAVFVAGLMVGRTPEYLGKKIEAFEMKMAVLVLLVPAATILVGTAVAVAIPSGRAAIGNPGPHGFTEALYAFTSAAGNNGSAFAGLSANTDFYDIALGVAMFAGRFFVAIPVLAIAGSLARKKIVPAGAGTLPTHGPLFVAMLVGVIVIVGALTFIPALALGPIVEQLLLVS